MLLNRIIRFYVESVDEVVAFFRATKGSRTLRSLVALLSVVSVLPLIVIVYAGRACFRLFDLSDMLIAPSNELRPSIPPAFAQFLIIIVSPSKRASAILGDLQEEFDRDLSMGVERARLLYWARCLRSLGPLLVTKIKRAGIIAAVIELGRRILG